MFSVQSCLDFLLSKPFEILLEVSSVLFTGATVIIAFKVHQTFALNHIKSKQVEHVCSLIEILNQSSISVLYSEITEHGGLSSTGSGRKFNIFELGIYSSEDVSQEEEEYADEPVLFDSESNQILEIKKYVDHPLTPRKIADALLRFHNPKSSIVKRSDPHLQIQKFIEIHTGIWTAEDVFENIGQGDLVKPGFEVFLSWQHLKESSKELKVLIGEWLIDNGIKANNIREDFKNFE